MDDHCQTEKVSSEKSCHESGEDQHSDDHEHESCDCGCHLHSHYHVVLNLESFSSIDSYSHKKLLIPSRPNLLPSNYIDEVIRPPIS